MLKSEPYDANYTALLLAAGQSRRFGAPKLMQPLPNGVWVGEQSAVQLLQVFSRVIAVVNPQQTELAARYRALGCSVYCHADAERGMGSSLAAGVRFSLQQEADSGQAMAAWVIALADMPFIQASSLQAVVAALQAGAGIAAPSYQGQRGHPVGFARCFAAELSDLDYDQGASPLLKRYAEQLQLVSVTDKGVLHDIDTPADLLRAL